MNSFKEILLNHVNSSNSLLCVGLDIDAARMTTASSPTFQQLKDFTRMVIDCTMDSVAAYKLNFAFFEHYGWEGFRWIEEVVEYIDKRRFTIADAKRGDISNSAKHYAMSIFDRMGFDAVTVNPYMGRDAILPFLSNPQKGAFVICLTSNKSASDLQLQLVNDHPLYHKVVEMVKDLNEYNNCGLVVGATQPMELSHIRQAAGDMPFLIPGIGAQGGDLESSVREGNKGGIALINVSRSVLYAGDQTEESIGDAARDYQKKINSVLQNMDMTVNG
ncbi:MAG: orotidine-5'-phosphate decarboxylase [Candidatus Marinimicrobia bacterium]|nr:orotidine-5'-phosphate decarboxylase [Candidatus Neomarinimicrobiota bacterium]